MKFFFVLFITFCLASNNLQADITKTVGTTGANFTTLKAAFDAINANTGGVYTGIITLQIIDNTNENASAVINASANWSSLLIYPTVAGKTISGNLATPLIDLNGADKVTIDGRVSLSGSTASLIILNSSTANNASAINFKNSAESNLVRYCNLQASSSLSPSMGIVTFGLSPAGDGNDNNIVEYCNITNSGSRPEYAIFSLGTLAHENSGNIIRYNNIYNFFNPATTCYGIKLGYATTNWTIKGNNFYETTTFAPTGAYSYYPIYINAGSDHIVSENYIGGSGPQCTGTFTINAMVPYYFCALYMEGGTKGYLQNNTISNFNCTSSEDNPWDGIYISSGNVDVTGNTIGSGTGIESIVISTPVAVASTIMSGGVVTGLTLLDGSTGYTTTPTVTFSTSGSAITAKATATVSGGVVTGIALSYGGAGYTSPPSVIFDLQSNNYSTSHGIIQNSSGTVNITGNTIGSITTVGSDNFSHGFESVFLRSVASTTTLTNNLIGSTSTANSINVSSTAANSLQRQDVFGLYSQSTGTTSISGNTIANVTNAYSGSNSGSKCRGIFTISGKNTILNNTVRDMVTSSRQTSTGLSASLIGISQICTTAVQTISGNKVYNLSNIKTGNDRVDVYGIYYSGPTSGINMVSGNFVHSINIASSNYLSVMDGVALYGGTTTCSNNIINLGVGITTGYSINGIWDNSGSDNNNSIYFNTVKIEGSVPSGTTSKTAALMNNGNTSTRNYRNNILYNARSGGTTGKHYAISLAGTTGLTIDYNDYYVSAEGILGYLGSDKITLALLKTATSQDANSLSINPEFATSGGTSVLNYSTSAALLGVNGTGITTDYSGLTRPSIPKMGALETNNYVWQGGTDTVFGTATNWMSGTVPPDGADIAFAATPANDCYLDQNRTLKNITNTSTKKFVVNGKQFSLTGSILSATANQIDAKAAGSVFVFAGTAAQIIPLGVFVSNTMDALTLNNSVGLTQNGDITVQAAMSLSNGIYTIGANTLTLNGSITTTSGILSGGSSSNIVIGGSGTTTTLPTVSLNNLILNRVAGISIAENITVAGTLTLTSGNLVLGANTLTLSGTAPVRTSGSIDAAYTGSTLIFTNPAAITLPASLFTGNLNNLTVNGAGITASGDISVNGILNLQSSNPSAVKGSFDLGSFTLTMGANATTTEIGDVTGIVKREHTFIKDQQYSFGSQYTTLTFLGTGKMPGSVSCKIVIGSYLPGKQKAILRYYTFNQDITDATDRVITKLRYLTSEVNGNDELKLVFLDQPINKVIEEHGKTNNSKSDHWVELSGLSINYLAPPSISPDLNKPWGLSNSELPKKTWLGSTSTDWNDVLNWSGGKPILNDNVLIPIVTSNLYPVLTSNVEIQTLEIATGASVTANSYFMTINGKSGAWFNNGTFNGGTGTVTFSYGIITDVVAISGTGKNDFNNIKVNVSTILQPATGTVIGIAGSVTNNGTFDCGFTANTVDYNGSAAQSIVNPNGSIAGYYNLTLSGSGIKTLPTSALALHGNHTVSGTASVVAQAGISISGNVAVESGASFTTGAFAETIGGHFTNNGTFTGTGSTLTFNGSLVQNIDGSGSTTFNNLTIDNSAGVTLMSDYLTTVLGNLTINLGKKFEILAGKQISVSGNIVNSGGTSGLILRSESGDATGTASLINSTNGVDATVERWMTGGIWHLISGAATGQTASSFIDELGNGIASNTNNYGLAPYNETKGDWDYFKVISFKDSITTHAKGYQVLRNAGGIVSFKGKLSGADLTIPIVKASNGWNLIGNPYPCALDIKKFLEANNNISIDPSYLGIYVADVADITEFGYIPVNYTNGDVTLKLASGEAFFVKSKIGGGTVSFTTDMKSHASDAFKSAFVYPEIKLVASDGYELMSTSVKYIPEMTKGLDPGWDSGLFDGGETAPFSVCTHLLQDNGIDFGIQCLPNVNYETMVIPIGLVAEQGSDVRFIAEAINLPLDYKVYLEDKFTGKFTRLDGPHDIYMVKLQTVSNGTGRFYLHTKTTIGAITSIEDKLIDQLKFIPLPQQQLIRVSGFVNLPAQAFVYDMNGRIVTSKSLRSSNENDIPLIGVSNGVYIIQIRSEKSNIQSKISWIN